MKTTRPSTIFKAVNALVQSTLPEFGDPTLVEVVETKKRLDLRRYRTDGTFERLFFEFSDSREGCLIGLQIAVSYFPECPIPSGPFGYDAGIEEMLWDTLRSRLHKFVRFDGWYRIGTATEPDTDVLKLIEEALLSAARPTLEEWSKRLLADDVLRIAVGSYREIEKNDHLEHAEELLSRRLDRIGPASDEGYPIFKLKSQLLQRLRGNKNWHMV